MIKRSIVVLFLSASLVHAGDSYFPLGMGNRWTYQSQFLISVNTFTDAVIGEEPFGGESYFIFSSFRLQESVPFRTEDRKVYTCATGGKSLMYDFSADDGASWSAPDPPEGFIGRMTLVGKTDSIATPAGVFADCIHFRHSFSGDVQHDEWFAPGVGLVRRISRLMSGLIESVLIEYNVTTAVRSDRADDPSGFALHGNYPNPFNSSTMVSFSAPSRYGGDVSLQVYDSRGRRIAGLMDGPCSGGIHRVGWNPHDQPSGIYFIRMTAGGFAQTRRAVLQK